MLKDKFSPTDRNTALVHVRKGRARAYLDDKLLAELKTDGSGLSLPDMWRMPDERSLGIGAYDAATIFHSIEVRPISDGAPLMAAASIAKGSETPSATPSVKSSSPSTLRPTTPSPRDTAPRVLIVIANQDFFYREYHDPRAQFERAGIAVEVAAGRKELCRPHHNSGQQGQPLSRWNAEVNGARLSPALSIGDPRTSADDVMVDGKIITGEDDNSSRLFGATLAKLLTRVSD